MTKISKLGLIGGKNIWTSVYARNLTKTIWQFLTCYNLSKKGTAREYSPSSWWCRYDRIHCISYAFPGRGGRVVVGKYESNENCKFPGFRIRGCQKESAANLQTMGKPCNDNISSIKNKAQAFPLQISLLTPVEVSLVDSAEGFDKIFKLGLTIFLLALLF